MEQGEGKVCRTETEAVVRVLLIAICGHLPSPSFYGRVSWGSWAPDKPGDSSSCSAHTPAVAVVG